MLHAFILAAFVMVAAAGESVIGAAKDQAAAPPATPSSSPPAPQPAESAATAPVKSGASSTQPVHRDDESDFRSVKPFQDVAVFINEASPERSRVEVSAFTCLDGGWLEQVACAPATREHESLVVVKAKPSQIHAALLMAGFEPGKPGRWVYEKDKFSVVNPTGEKLDIHVRYADKSGKLIEHPIAKWIRHPETPKEPAKDFPDEPFVFGGSAVEKNTPDMGPGEHYVADMSGSIIGLVTFGDEMIGFSQVLSDQDSVQEPVYEANTPAMPEVGTPVTLVIRKRAR